jgi:hypothetical protein
MRKPIQIAAAALVALLCVPMPAFAADGTMVTISLLHLSASLLGLVVAVVLLLEALAMRRVALGGAIAEKMSYVVLAIVCLAASALARWTGNFVVDVTLEQTQLASEFLAIVAMALLTAYFYSVRTAMQSYLKSMTATEPVPHAQVEESNSQNEDESRG